MRSFEIYRMILDLERIRKLATKIEKGKLISTSITKVLSNGERIENRKITLYVVHDGVRIGVRIRVKVLVFALVKKITLSIDYNCRQSS